MRLFFRKNFLNTATWFLLFGVSLIAVYFFISGLFVFKNIEAASTTDGIVIYATSTSMTLQYRTYASSTNAFSNAASAGAAIFGNNVRHIDGDSSPASNEMIVGISSDNTLANATLTMMRWTGSAWATDWTSSLSTSTARAFNISYYGNTGNAIVVYATSTTATQLDYRTWNGSVWSATGTITLAAPDTAVWVETSGFEVATSNPRVIMGYQTKKTSATVGARMGAAIWNGSAWGQATTTGMAMTTNSNEVRQFDVAFESTSGDAFWIFGFKNAAGLLSASCNSGCSSWTTNALHNPSADDADFVDIAASPQPGSNKIAIGTCGRTTTLDDAIIATMWTGAGFITGSAVSSVTVCDDLLTQGTFPTTAGWYGTSDIAVIYWVNAATAGSVFRSKCASCTGAVTFAAMTTINAGAACVLGAYRSTMVVPFGDGGAKTMMTIISRSGTTNAVTNGNMCNLIDNQSTTAVDPTPIGAEGWVQSSNRGFSTWFGFFKGNKAPTAPTQSGPTNGATTSSTPSFVITSGGDTDNDNLSYKVTIYDNAGCSSVVQTNNQADGPAAAWLAEDATCTNAPTSCYAPSTRATYVTQSALSAGTQYWWRASAEDPDGSSTFVDSATCNSFTTEAPSLTFTIDTGNVSFVGAVTPGTPVATSSVLTVNTTNSTGYNISINRASTTPTLFVFVNNATTTIPDTPNGNNWTAAAATSTVGPSAIWTDGTTKGLGFRIKQTGTVSNTYATTWWGISDAAADAKYSGISTSTQMIANTTLGSGSNENTAVEYKIDVNTNQRSGTYISSPAVYTVTVNP